MDLIKRLARVMFILFWLSMLYLIASNIQAGWLYVVIAFFVILIVVSLVYPELCFRGIETALILPEYMERDAGAAATLVLRNRSRFARPMLRVTMPPGDFQLDPQSALFVTVPRRGEARMAVRGVCGRRGLCEPRVILISCGAPAGIFTAKRRILCSGAALVYPSLKRGREKLPEKDYGVHNPGPLHRIMAMQDPFHYMLREYTPGDSLRSMHWKLTARRGEPIVRTPEHKIIGHASVVVDNLRSSYPPDGEALFEDVLERSLAAVHKLLFDHNYTVTISGTAAPLLTIGSEAGWERGLRWFALIRLEDDPLAAGMQSGMAMPADVLMEFGLERNSKETV